MANILLVALISVGGGFLVAAGSALLLGNKKAHRYPGGSLSMGFMTGIAFQAGVAVSILGALCGVLGWLLYRLLFPVRN